jgi:hypothetical protein
MSDEYEGFSWSFAKACRKADAERRKAAEEGRTVPVISKNSVVYLKPRERKQPILPASTIQTVEFLINQNNPEQLRQWLATCTRREREAIKAYFQQKEVVRA